MTLLALLLIGGIALQLLNPPILMQFIGGATSGGADRTLAMAAGLFLGAAFVQQALSVAATYLSENVGGSAMRCELTCCSIAFGWIIATISRARRAS